MNKTDKDKKILIWDLPTRLFHWLLVVSLFAAWYTSEQEGEMVEQHMLIGYFILGLVLFRIIWGFVGTKHARFASFFPTPSVVKQYISEVSTTKNTTGHNPLGAIMVFIMLLLILFQATTGLFINDDIFSEGPYYGVLNEYWQQVASFIHHNSFNLLIAAIALHIAAILYYRLSKNINLVLPMITGKKPADEVNQNESISNSKLWLAGVLIILVTVFVYWLVVLNVPVVEEEIFF